MSFLQDLFAPPSIDVEPRKRKISNTTTKIVGKPLSAVYGRTIVFGNTVYRRINSDKTRVWEDIALCWGPVTFDTETIRVNDKRPHYINGALNPDREEGPGYIPDLKVWTMDGSLGQGTKAGRTFNYNRTAMLLIEGKANEDFSQVQSAEVVVTRANIFGTSDYQSLSSIASKRASNPVWAALDWMTNQDYGAGRPESDFNITQITNAAAYCDVQVTTEGTNTEARWSVNGEFGQDPDVTHTEIAEQILSTCGGAFFQSNGKINIHVPRPKSAVAQLDRSNFIPTGASTTDVMEVPNIVEVAYTDSLTFDERKVRWSDPASIAEFGEIRKEVDIPWITSRTMASRIARWIGRKNKAQTITMKGDADQRFLNVEPGDVVGLTVGDETTTWFNAKNFWVMEVTPENRDGDVNFRFLEYGGDTLFDDGLSDTLDASDPINNDDPSLALPLPNQQPLPPTAFSYSIGFEDKNGTKEPYVDLSWSKSAQPDYMHQDFVIYRRASLTDPWVQIGATIGAQQTFRDTAAAIDQRTYYYAITSRTSAGVESPLPGDGVADITAIATKPSSVTSLDVQPQRNEISTGVELILALTWTDTAQTPDTFYRAWYSFNSGPYVYIGETQTLSIQLPGLITGSYQFKVVAYDVNGIPSSPTVASFTIDPDNFITLSTVSNVRLYQGGTAYTGRDPEITWDASYPAGNIDYDQRQYRVYRVRVLTTTDTLLREETVATNRYVYSYEKNLEDGLNRDFKVSVTIVGIDGAETAAAEATFTNAVPALPNNVQIRSTFDTIFLQYDKPGEADWTGIKVWLDTSSSFAPDDATNLVYDGPNTLVIIDGLDANTQYYLKYAGYDSFGSNNAALTISGSQAITTGIDPISLQPPVFSFEGLTFTPDSPSADSVAWTAGKAHVTRDGTTTTYSITSGNAAWTSGVLYIYYTEAGTALAATTNIATATANDKIILATYEGGTNLRVGNGDAFFSGSKILAQTVGATQLVTSTAVITETAQLANAIVTDAKIGSITFDKAVGSTLTAGSVYIGGNEFKLDGANMQLVITDKQGTPQERVKIGQLGATSTDYGIEVRDASGNLIMSTGSGINESLVDALGLLNGPTEANADVTGNNTSADTLAVDGTDSTVIRKGSLLSFRNGLEANEFGDWTVPGSNTLTADVNSFSGAQAGLFTSTIDTATAAASGSTGGVRITIPEEVALAFGGKRITIQVYARQPASGAATNFAVAYSTSDVGNSGWQIFDVSATGTAYAAFKFQYDVPDPSSGGADYLGILGDADGLGGGTIIDNVTIAASVKDSEIDALGLINAPAEAGAEVTTGKSLSLLTDRTADNIVESLTRKWAAESGADVTSGKSLTVLTDRTADNISESTGRKWAGESGADVTGNNTAANTSSISSATDAGLYAFLDQLTSANIGTYIATAAIGDAYIIDLQAGKLSGVLAEFGSLTVGSGTGGGYIRFETDGEIRVHDGTRNRVWMGNIGGSYGFIVDGPNGERMLDSRSGNGVNGTYIQDLTVGTLKIQNNAVTDVAASTSSSTQSPGNTSWNDLVTVSITKPDAAGFNTIACYCDGDVSVSNTSHTAQVRLLRNGSVIFGPVNVYTYSYQSNGENPASIDFRGGFRSFTTSDNVGSGTFTYKLQGRSTVSGAANFNTKSIVAEISMK